MTAREDEDFKLPEEPRLELVAAALKLSQFEESTQIQTVFQHQTQSGLKLYLPRGLNIRCQLASAGVEEVHDHQGGVSKLLSCGDSQDFNSTLTLIQVGRCDLTQDYNLNVSSIWGDGIEYLPTDETGMFLDPLLLPPANLFALRDELLAFIEKDIAAVPSYADPDSEHYAPELALALKLHQELIVTGAQAHLSVEGRVSSWLDENAPENLSERGALTKRLAAVINNKKKKGNPFYRDKTKS
jgi:hypothetical protein